ncbi:GTP cyclohydrolase I FolE [Amnibacterium sp. CER49]|uniref:GTP cyclohydrolase I n=1 Tax=Amnibacterium sp. CER49 TaxID=3039161 RepID=UPI002448B70D|nr:GTP cyclohydrolase I FolE [Amnibacterium sp. CER49]MDH2443285.1 GTP cyclohydrolase I FolE [Amnibacterium sp. CER49]
MTDLPRAARAVAELLAALGEDVRRPGLARTPDLVAAAAAELFAGVGQDPAALLAAGPAVDGPDGVPVALTGIPFRSLCEHHLLPFAGTVSVVYRPAGRLAGLGTLVRAVELASARPTVQERLTDELAAALERGLGAAGVLVRAEADHACLWARGTRTRGATLVTLAARGVYGGPARAEALALLPPAGSR